MVQPSLAREGFSPIPDVKLEDVGALDQLRELFNHYILGRIKHSDDYKVIFCHDTKFLTMTCTRTNTS